MTALLSMDGITVTLGGRDVLQVEHLEIAGGETIAVLGPNGAGKSTLLRLAGALVRPSAGIVRIDGEPATERRARETTAAVLQRPLLRRGSVALNVASGLRFQGVPRTAAAERAAEWMRRLDIAHLGARNARGLSGGEAQRVSLARAFATQPRLLLLDEPFAALDEPTRGRMVLELRGLLAEHGIAALLVTHDRRQAAALASRTAVLSAGTMRAVGPTAQVLADPTLTDVTGSTSLLDAALTDCMRPGVAQRHEAWQHGNDPRET